MKKLVVSFNHKTGNDNMIIKIDDSVLLSSVDKGTLAQFIELQSDYEDVNDIDIVEWQ